MQKIKGVYKQIAEKPSQNLASEIFNVSQLHSELLVIRDSVVEKINKKLKEVDNTTEESKQNLLETIKVLDEVNEKIEYFDEYIEKVCEELEEYKENIKEEAIETIREIKQGEKGKDADEEKIYQKIFQNIPKVDEDKILKKILKQVPTTKSDLKIIQENIEIDPMSVIDKIMALPEEKRKKLQLGTDNISGLEQTMRAFQSQLGRGYLHGGGISNITGLVTAGTNVTITGSGTTTSPYVINSSGGGGGTPGGSDTQVQFNDGGAFGGESTFTFDKTLVQMSVGGIDTMTVNGSLIGSKIATHAGDGLTQVDIEMHKHSATAGAGASIYGARSRGGVGTETIVQNGDAVLNITGVGFDGTDYATLAQIQFEVDGTPGSNDMPGRILFNTSSDGGQTLTERLRIGANGDLTVAGLAGSGSRVVVASATGVLSATTGLIDGTGLNTQITYWTDSNTIAGSTAFTYNDTTKILTLTNGASPAKRAFLADGINFDIGMGDISSAGNNTAWYVADSSSSVQLTGDDGAGSTNLIIDISTDPTSIGLRLGDVGGVGNGTAIAIDDQLNNYEFSSANFVIRNNQYTFPGDQGIQGTVLFNTDGSGTLDYQRPSKTFFAQTSDGNVNDTVSSFSSLLGIGWGSPTIPENFAISGTTVEIQADGFFGVTGTPTLTFRFTVLGGTIPSPTITMPNNVAGRAWTARITATVRTDGASGTMYAQGMIGFSDSSGSMVWYPINSSSTIAIDTTGNTNTDILVAWGTQSPSNTITSTNVTFKYD